MLVDYPAHLTMREALAMYFEANAFGDDGGYAAKWVDFKFGPVPLPFPNTAARVRAVRFHDLHHLLTQYNTDWRGEFEISAWEIGAGCARMPAAWIINLGAVAAGALTLPKRTFLAFARGLRDRSLYRETYEELLDMKVGDVRARFLNSDAPTVDARDALMFALAALLGTLVGLTELAVFLPLVPVGVVALSLARAGSESSSATRAEAGT